MTSSGLLKILLRPALAAAALATFAPARANGAGAASEADVKAAYIFNFTRFVEWQTQTASSASAHFDICALGRDPANEPLSSLPVTEVLGQKTRVRLIVDEEGGLAGCRILFIGRSKHKQAAAIAGALRGTGVLTVSSQHGFARAGGIIGFSTEKGRIKLEINLKAAREAGLKINYRLLELSDIVRDDH